MKKKENVSEIFYFLIYLQGEQNDLGKRFPDPAYLLSSWRMQGQVLSFDNLIKSPGPNAALASPLRFMDGANEAWPRGGLVWNHSVLSHVVRPRFDSGESVSARQSHLLPNPFYKKWPRFAGIRGKCFYKEKFGAESENGFP